MLHANHANGATGDMDATYRMVCLYVDGPNALEISGFSLFGAFCPTSEDRAARKILCIKDYMEVF